MARCKSCGFLPSPEGCTRLIILGRRIKREKVGFFFISSATVPLIHNSWQWFHAACQRSHPDHFYFPPSVCFIHVTHLAAALTPPPPPQVTKTQWHPSNTAEFQDTELETYLTSSWTEPRLPHFQTFPGGGSLCWDDSRVRRLLFSIRTVELLIGSHGAPPTPPSGFKCITERVLLTEALQKQQFLIV